MNIPVLTKSLPHQKKQVEVINQIEQQIKDNSLAFSTVSPVLDYENDSRICLTSVHLPNKDLVRKIQKSIIKPLYDLSPDHYYYPDDSLHLTIKNIRVISDPPTFNDEDIEKVKKVFSEIIPNHKKFKVYFYRLLTFPNNLALLGTTDPELDDIIFSLDKKLKEAGVPDNKQYTNSRYFFSNITLARFTHSLTQTYKDKIAELSDSISFNPYTVDSVRLLSCNAVLKKRRIIGTWNLK